MRKPSFAKVCDPSLMWSVAGVRCQNGLTEISMLSQRLIGNAALAD